MKFKLWIVKYFPVMRRFKPFGDLIDVDEISEIMSNMTPIETPFLKMISKK